MNRRYLILLFSLLTICAHTESRGQNGQIVIAENSGRYGGFADFWVWDTVVSPPGWRAHWALNSNELGGKPFDDGDAFAVGDVYGTLGEEVIIAEDSGESGGRIEIWEFYEPAELFRPLVGSLSFESAYRGYALQVGDVYPNDGDPKDEIVIAHDNYLEIWSWDQNNSNFFRAARVDNIRPHEDLDLVIGDFLGTPLEEIVIARQDGASVSLFQWDENSRTFIEPYSRFNIAIVDAAHVGSAKVVAGDVAGDYKSELIIAEEHNGYIDVRAWNDATNQFVLTAPANSHNLDTEFNRGDAIVVGDVIIDYGDYRGDPKEEIIIAEEEDGNVDVYVPTYSGGFYKYPETLESISIGLGGNHPFDEGDKIAVRKLKKKLDPREQAYDGLYQNATFIVAKVTGEEDHYDEGVNFIVQEGWGNNRKIGFSDAEDAIYYAIKRTEDPDIPKKVLDPSGKGLEQWKVFIRRGEYKLSPDFYGFDMMTGLTVELEPGAMLRVPNGYRGYVFRFKGMTRNAKLIGGGHIDEIGSEEVPSDNPKRQWIGVKLHASSELAWYNDTGDEWREINNVIMKVETMGAPQENLVSGLLIKNAKIGVQLLLDFYPVWHKSKENGKEPVIEVETKRSYGDESVKERKTFSEILNAAEDNIEQSQLPEHGRQDGWWPKLGYIWGNKFESIYIQHPVKFVEFKIDPDPMPQGMADEIRNNLFDNVIGQALQGTTECGISDIMHRANTFINVSLSDVERDDKCNWATETVEIPDIASIRDGTVGTVILGGLMTKNVKGCGNWKLRFKDEGSGTIILDQFGSKVPLRIEQDPTLGPSIGDLCVRLGNDYKYHVYCYLNNEWKQLD